MKKTHVITVSAQTIPNVLPVLNDIQKGDECTVVICASAEQQKTAEWIEQFFKKKYVDYKRFKDKVPGNDWASLYRYFEKVRASVQGSRPDQIVVNLTGGTKLMSIAAWAAFSRGAKEKTDFREKEKTDFIYVDTPKGSDEFPSCQHLFNSNSKEKETLSEPLSVEDFLMLYGKNVANQECAEISDAERAFFKDMIGIAQKNKKLDKIIGEWYDGNEVQRWEAPALDAALEVMEAHRLNPREKTRKYLTGGWFELYVYDILKKNSKRWGISDVATGISYKTSGDNANEVDVLFVRNNRLFVVECKSGAIGEKKYYKNLSYKFKDVASALGIACTGWFVSIHKLAEGDAKRLNEAEKIKVCSGEENIEAWIDRQFNPSSK